MKHLKLEAMFEFSADVVSIAIAKEIRKWKKESKLQRLWKGDSSIWTRQDENQWIGWLDIASGECSELKRLGVLTQEIKKSGFTDLVLLGMGGSSLCSAMLAETFGKIGDYPQLHILDSTDPLQLRHLEESVDLKHTFFIVASKSGSTLEPNICKQYFYHRLQQVLGQREVGHYFMAITDPGSSLEKLAKKSHFKAIFHGSPTIGGRYSALSNFGVLPASLMGVDVKGFLYYAEQMAQACGPQVLPQNNPGVMLGIILGVCAQQGKDKLTLIVSPGIQALGAWLEQLIAESTGKQGKGIIPVDQEPLGSIHDYGSDRVFAYIRLGSEPDAQQERRVEALEQAGHVVVRCHLPEKIQLGAELFRWEMATAVAGSVLGINPFDQPDVEASKVRALHLMTEYEKTGSIPTPHAFFAAQGLQLFTDDANLQEMNDHLEDDHSLAGYLRAHFNRIQIGDYVHLAAFIEMNAENTELLQQSRIYIRDAKKVATSLGFGPRFLHSTGQIYKGGPNTGVFLQITTEHPHDLPIPGENYTFGLMIAAQAQADFEVLTQRSRRALRVHLTQGVREGLEQLNAALRRALQMNAKLESEKY